MIKDKDYEAINNIMRNFDFEKVFHVMLMLDWKWAMIGGVPSVIDLRNEARSLLETCCRKKLNSISCGGFHVFRGEEGLLRLLFSIAEWVNYD